MSSPTSEPDQPGRAGERLGPDARMPNSASAVLPGGLAADRLAFAGHLRDALDQLRPAAGGEPPENYDVVVSVVPAGKGPEAQGKLLGIPHPGDVAILAALGTLTELIGQLGAQLGRYMHDRPHAAAPERAAEPPPPGPPGPADPPRPPHHRPVAAPEGP